MFLYFIECPERLAKIALPRDESVGMAFKRKNSNFHVIFIHLFIYICSLLRKTTNFWDVDAVNVRRARNMSTHFIVGIADIFACLGRLQDSFMIAIIG